MRDANEMHSKFLNSISTERTQCGMRVRASNCNRSAAVYPLWAPKSNHKTEKRIKMKMWIDWRSSEQNEIQPTFHGSVAMRTAARAQVCGRLWRSARVVMLHVCTNVRIIFHDVHRESKWLVLYVGTRRVRNQTAVHTCTYIAQPTCLAYSTSHTHTRTSHNTHAYRLWGCFFIFAINLL